MHWVWKSSHLFVEKRYAKNNGSAHRDGPYCTEPILSLHGAEQRQL